MGLAAALSSSSIFAMPSSRFVYLRGEGAEACPTEDSARGAVAARLGYDPFVPKADNTIVLEIAPDRDELLGRVRLVDERGQTKGSREFRTPPSQCDELLATMALAVSIAIDPSIENGAPASIATAAAPSALTPKPALATEAPLPDAEATAPAPGATNSAPLQMLAGLALSASVGTSPELTPGAALSLGLRRASLSIALEGRIDGSSSEAVPTGGSVRSSLWVVGLLPCFHLGSWLGCGAAEVGSLHASGVDLVTRHTDDAFYAAVGARVAYQLPLPGPFFLRPELDVLANLTRPELRVDGALVWQVAPFSALAGIAVLASFP